MSNVVIESGPETLATGSPGLYGRLCQSLEPKALESLERIYALASLANYSTEPRLNRSEAASYNPRPARIAAILLKECCETDPTVLGASMLACAGADGLLALGTLAAEHLEEVSLAKQALSFPENHGKAPERIYLALKLDELRHLHMRTDLSPERVQNLLKESLERDLKSLRFKENARLERLVRAAVERFLRRPRPENSKLPVG